MAIVAVIKKQQDGGKMIELTGKYNTAKVFTDHAESSAVAQIQHLLGQPFIAGSQIRVMPDCHAGMGCTVGMTMTVTNKICPNLIGVDISCGVHVAVPSEGRRVFFGETYKHHLICESVDNRLPLLENRQGYDQFRSFQVLRVRSLPKSR